MSDEQLSIRDILSQAIIEGTKAARKARQHAIVTSILAHKDYWNLSYVDLLQQASQHHSDLARVFHYMCSNFYLDSGVHHDIDEATSALEQALAAPAIENSLLEEQIQRKLVNPPNFVLQGRLGLCYLLQKEYDLALEILSTARKEISDDDNIESSEKIRMNTLYAYACLYTGDHKQAFTTATRMIREISNERVIIGRNFYLTSDFGVASNHIFSHLVFIYNKARTRVSRSSKGRTTKEVIDSYFRKHPRQKEVLYKLLSDKFGTRCLMRLRSKELPKEREGLLYLRPYFMK